MKARELIEELKQCPPNHDVVIDYSTIKLGPRDDMSTDVDPGGYCDVVDAALTVRQLRCNCDCPAEFEDPEVVELLIGLESNEHRK